MLRTVKGVLRRLGVLPRRQFDRHYLFVGGPRDGLTQDVPKEIGPCFGIGWPPVDPDLVPKPEPERIVVYQLQGGRYVFIGCEDELAASGRIVDGEIIGGRAPPAQWNLPR